MKDILPFPKKNSRLLLKANQLSISPQLFLLRHFRILRFVRGRNPIEIAGFATI